MTITRDGDHPRDVVILRIFTILQDGYFHDSKGQGRLMLFYHPWNGDLPGDDDCPRDGDHHRYDGQ